MRRILFLLLAAFATAAAAQVSIGIRDNRYAAIEYAFKDRFHVALEQSVYSEKLPFQYTRAYFGYSLPLAPNLKVTASPYFGMAWNNNYRNLGLLGSVHFKPCRFGVYGTINPHYDSTFKYKTMFRAGAEFSITNQIDLSADYSTIPVYRQEEKLVRIGVGFKVKNLSARPVFAIPVAGNGKYKSVQILMSCKYTFK